MDLRRATVPALDALPGLVHGFEQRDGSLEAPEASRRRVAAVLAAHGRLLLLRQVHGATVLEAPWEGRPEGDAAVAARAGLLLGIVTADCLPVLLVDPVGRRVAAAHAGWRGTVAGVTAAAVRTLIVAGSRPSDLLAALGPSIGPCCYEVGDELPEAFGPEGAHFFRPGPRGRPHLDVRAANVHQLEAAGLSPHRIHHVDDCTMCHPELYYSYRRDVTGGQVLHLASGSARTPGRTTQDLTPARRDGPGTGRMISFIGYKTP
jgi:YfiH family protein